MSDSMNVSSNLIDVKDVTKYYGKQKVLDELSFSVEPGKIVGLLGPNGSGKTTIIKILNGLIKDYKGDVRVCDYEIGVESKNLISYLPDVDILPSWLKVSDTVKLYKDFYKDFDHDKAYELLNTLKVIENKKISHLSKGMKEKLMLALTMSRKAKIYILDEPIAGVDPAAREVIMSTILNNFEDGSSILMSTHIISDVEAVFDDVFFLKDGKIILSGSSEEIRNSHNKSIDQLFREVYRC